MKSLEELQQPDARTLHFTPLGLGSGVQLRPEDAVEFQQSTIDRFELAAEVADGTRSSFEHLRTVFPYGVLCYEVFTLINDQALLVVEQALRDRFLEWHHGTVVFADENGMDHPVGVRCWDEVRAVLKRRAHRQWKLRIDPSTTIPFNGMLDGLRRWARAARLLRGQRNRGIEHAISSLRNSVAHPDGYHLCGPVEAARTLNDLAEIINQLWGAATPGGRLYPAPIRRDPVAIGWSPDGTHILTRQAEWLPATPTPGEDDWQYVIVRAVYHPGIGPYDRELERFDARFESTRYPVELLCGPGPVGDVAAWFAANRPTPDMCDYLDQTFAIHRVDRTLQLPMRPAVAAGLSPADRSGIWYIIRADNGIDAFNHVRNLLLGSACRPDGECTGCPAETLRVGSFQEAIIDFCVPQAVQQPPDVATPRAHPRSMSYPVG